MPRDFPSRPPVQTTSQNEVTIVANETNKTQINESSSDFEFLDSLEVNTSDSSFSRGQKLDESEVFIVNSNYINDRDGRGRSFFSNLKKNKNEMICCIPNSLLSFFIGFNDRRGSYLEETIDEMTFEEEDDVDRPNVKDMSHVSVIKVGDDSSHPIQCSRHNEEKKPSSFILGILI